MEVLVRLVVIDVVVVVVTSVGIGALAPRWPSRWLRFDPVPRMPWESAEFFRRLKVSRWATRIPELGDTFGGRSKNAIPGASTEALSAYLLEVRRAEWVHWGSVLSSLVLFAFNPWWLALIFLIAVSLGNAPFLIVLRNNRFRIQRILERESRSS